MKLLTASALLLLTTSTALAAENWQLRGPHPARRAAQCTGTMTDPVMVSCHRFSWATSCYVSDERSRVVTSPFCMTREGHWFDTSIKRPADNPDWVRDYAELTGVVIESPEQIAAKAQRDAADAEAKRAALQATADAEAAAFAQRDALARNELQSYCTALTAAARTTAAAVRTCGPRAH